MKRGGNTPYPNTPPPLPSRPLAVFFCSHLFASICIYTLTQYTARSARFSTRSIFLYRMIYKYGKIILTSRVRYQVSLAHKYSQFLSDKTRLILPTNLSGIICSVPVLGKSGGRGEREDLTKFSRTRRFRPMSLTVLYTSFDQKCTLLPYLPLKTWHPFHTPT